MAKRWVGIAFLLVAAGCRTGAPPAPRPDEYHGFGTPQPVRIAGYEGAAMEPFLTRDGRYLLFNNSNDPRVNTNLHYARRIDGLNFQYLGELEGANTSSLDGVATADRLGNLYFISTRNYESTLSTVFRARFQDGDLRGVKLVESVSEKTMGRLVFDVEVSADGNVLVLSDGTFRGGVIPEAADLSVAVRRGADFHRETPSTLLEQVNSAKLEYAAALSANGLELFFTRIDSRHPSIYRSTRASVTAPFGTPLRVGALDGFVEAPAFSADDRDLYFHKRDGRRYRIYFVERK